MRNVMLYGCIYLIVLCYSFCCSTFNIFLMRKLMVEWLANVLVDSYLLIEI